MSPPLNAKRLLLVVGTRPNFIKITQFHRVLRSYPGVELKLCHTGQHFDAKMSDIFFSELGIPAPDFRLESKAASTIGQFTAIINGLEGVITACKPEVVLVPGDVNSTFAAAFTAHKMGVKVAHIESGLRSFDRTMPEENNRILTDGITDIFFTTEQSGVDNLLREGRPRAAIHEVGNTMIDTLLAFQPQIEQSTVRQRLGIDGPYALMTMHRPATVDRPEGLDELHRMIARMAASIPVVFPIHPRTRKNIQAFGLQERFDAIAGLRLIDPAGYLDFQHLAKHAQVVVTDSGGVQEETTYYRVPCITLRANTERPCTVDIGSNVLLDPDRDRSAFFAMFDAAVAGRHKAGAIPPNWDGKSTERIVRILCGEPIRSPS